MRYLFILIGFLINGLALYAQPANDGCGNATPLVVDAPCVAGTNVNATSDGNPSCGFLTFYANNTVWYSFVATGPNTQISVTNISGDLNVIMTLYNSCGSGSFKCVDATGNNQNESVVQNTVSGNTYWICIDGSGTILPWPFTGDEDGTFCIQISTYIAPPNPSGDCAGAQPFCTGTTYQFPAGTNTQSQAGPNYGCLLTQPNPAWYYLKISQNGPIDIHMASDAGVDIDFICWGPFTSEIDACTQISGGGGAQVDCSYSTAAEEDCNIPNAIVGEYYMLLITNYSNQPTNIIFSQTGGAGATDCSIINPIIAQNNGPFCPGQTLQLNATTVANATYSWSGPNGFSSAIRNPTLTSITVAESGIYTLTTTINATVYTSTTTVTVFAANSAECFQSTICTIDATVANPSICAGSSTTIQASGTIGTAVLSNPFDNGTVGVGWVGTPTANFSNPGCAGAPPYGTTYLWMDNTTPAPRNLESNDFNVQFGGMISFWLKYAVQAGVTPCEGPDEGGEGVTLQYSTTNGTSWTDIVYFSPNGTQMATNPDPGYTNHAQVASGATTFTTWGRYVFQIPPGASTTSSRFRWMQYHSTDANTDNWGIDSVLILTPPQAVTIVWTSNPPGFNQTGNGPLTVSPTVTTWYIASISDGTTTCKDSVKVTLSTAAAGFTTNDTTQCKSNNTFNFTNQGLTGVNYFWNFGDGPLTSPLENPTHSYTNTGTFTVEQIVQSGTCTDTVLHNVYVYAEPTLTFDSVPSCMDTCTGTLIVYPSGTLAPYSYNWSNSDITQTITGVCGGTFTVIVTDANGCSTMASTDVTEYPAPSVDIDSVPSCKNICNGSLTAFGFGTTGPYNYFWSNLINSQTINNLCVGNYIVTVIDGNGCSGTGTNVVSYYPNINVITSSTRVKCNGENNGTATAIASGGGSNGTFMYQWGLNANNQTTSTAVALYSGSYQVTITDNLGCGIDTTVNVSQPNILAITTSPDTNLCYNTFCTLFAYPTGGTNPYTYHWNGTIGGSTLSDDPEYSTTYSVYVTDSNNCISNTNTIYVSVDPKLQINIYAEDTMICPGTNAIISAFVQGGDGGPYYLYDVQGNNLEMPYKPYPASNPENICIIAKDRCGSVATDTIPIYLNPVPSIVFNSDRFNGCQPLTVYFNENTDNTGSDYFWDFNDESNSMSYSRNPVHTFEAAGVYDISLTVTSTEGCQNTSTVSAMITVYTIPEARFISDPELVSIIEPVVTFTNYSSNYIMSIWHFDDGDSSLFNSPIHVYKAIGKYEVSLVAISEHGCKDSTVQEIVVKDEYSFYAPSAFSPDADGINDIFNVYGHGINPNKFFLKIYDRWGQILFETNKLTEGWNGKIKNSSSGKDVIKSGVYTWFVVYYDLSGVVHQKSGPVTLIH